MSNIRPEKEMSFSSGDWAVLRNWLSQELQMLQDKLCGVTNTPDETQVLRGRIMEIKTILNFEKQAASARLAVNNQE